MNLFLKLLSLLILTVPTLAFAQDVPQSYTPLVGIPGVTGAPGSDGYFDSYLQAVYATSISLAALLAVIKIVVAGVKWMTTDIVSSKSDAKKDIEGAILGLVVILAAVLILYIINPNIGTVDLSLNAAPRPAPVVPLPDSVQALQTCTERPAGGCSTHTCDTENTPPCSEIVESCQALPGFVSIEEFGENNLACISNSTTITNIDLTGGGVFEESAISTAQLLTTETLREGYERVEAEIEAAGNVILFSARGVTQGTSQTAFEERCSRRTGATEDQPGNGRIVYLLDPSGLLQRSLCVQ